MNWHDPETQDRLQQANGEGCMEGVLITGLIAAVIFVAAMAYTIHSYETLIASIAGGG